MKKNIFGRKFSRDTNQRKSLFKSLITSLIFEESIKTTTEKAKAIKGDVDKIVNKAKNKNANLALQFLQRDLGNDAINKLIKDIAPRFSDRKSGYTRTINLGRRFSDNAALVLMEWVTKPEIKNKTTNIKNDIKELPSGEVKKNTKAEVKESKLKRKVRKK